MTMCQSIFSKYKNMSKAYNIKEKTWPNWIHFNKLIPAVLVGRVDTPLKCQKIFSISTIVRNETKNITSWHQRSFTYNDIDVILSSPFMWWDHISSTSPLHIQKGNKTERNFPNNIKQIDDNHWVHDLLYNFRFRKFWIESKFCAKLVVALICSAWDINWLRSFKISKLKMQRWRRRNKNKKIGVRFFIKKTNTWNS